MPISDTASTYLNFVRWAAAFAVFLFHFRDHQLGPDQIWQFFPANGHGYVIVFFVISGFCISMVAERKSAAEFVADRAVRIYLVALPALLLTDVLAHVIQFDRPGGSISLALNAVFLGESWRLDLSPPLNRPYWSLCYEVMYYFIFGCFWYVKGSWKLVWGALASLIAGPKILILFPCWLVGALVYWLRLKYVNQTAGWTALIGGPILVLVAMGSYKNELNSLSNNIGFQLTASEGFLRSYVVALAFAVHLWGVCQINIKFPTWFCTLAEGGAATSYSLYLLHFPLLMTGAYVLGDKSPLLILAVPAIVLVCFLFAWITERKRQAITRGLSTLVCGLGT